MERSLRKSLVPWSLEGSVSYSLVTNLWLATDSIMRPSTEKLADLVTILGETTAILIEAAVHREANCATSWPGIHITGVRTFRAPSVTMESCSSMRLLAFVLRIGCEEG